MSFGPLDFEEVAIKKKVAEDSIGNFALGYVKQSTGGFVPKYVGRSDSDVRGELLAKLETKSPTRQKFKFDYAHSVKEAFDMECENYHDFIKQLENEIHPRRPDGKDYPCPVKGCTELD
jgi:hypothetical protein